MSLALSVLAAGCFIIDPSANQSTFEALGPVAERQLTIFWWILIGGAVVLVLVGAALIYSIVKFRRRSEEEIPKQVHGNTRLELLWTIIPAIVVMGFAIASINTLYYSANVPKDSEKTITLEARMAKYWRQIPNHVKEGTAPQFKTWIKRNMLNNPEVCPSEKCRRSCAAGEWKWKSLKARLYRAGIPKRDHWVYIQHASSSKGHLVITTEAVNEILKHRQARRKKPGRSKQSQK